MAIISLSGKCGAGKDTAGKIIQYLVWKQTLEKLYLPKTLELTKGQSLKTWVETEHIEGWGDINGRHSGWQIKKWADPLRKIAAILLGMNEEYLYTTEFKESILPECWARTAGRPGVHTLSIGMSGRQFLQKLGTDAIRNQLHEQSWVNALMAEYKPTPFYIEHPPKWPNWIITDTRFPNELSAVKKAGGVTIRIERDLLPFNMNVHTVQHSSETSLDTADFDFVVENNGTIEDLAQKLLPIISNLNSNGYNSTEGS